MKRFLSLLMAVSVWGLVLAGGAFAVVPNTLTYQGHLTDAAGAPLTTTLEVVFAVYDGDMGGTPLWTETQSVAVEKGGFSAVLGAQNPLPADLFLDAPRYLGIAVGNDSEMVPREEIGSTPFSLKAREAETVTNAAITEGMIATGTITNASISPSAAIQVAKISGLGTLATMNRVGNAEVSDTAGIQDSKLATISSPGKVADSALSANVVLMDSGQTLGAKTFTDQITSTVATGTAPFQVASNTVVSNLNADLLDGQHANEIVAAAVDEKRAAISSLPYTITAPGSYYLTGNLSTLGMGITINADNVTIDLGGFTITGPGASNTGIWMGGRSNVEMRNGSVTGFNYGIYENNATGKNHRVINVRVLGNWCGIYLSGAQNLVEDCTASNNTGDGIYVGNYSRVTGCLASANGTIGIHTGTGSTVTGNTVANNTTNGIEGGYGLTITGNTVSGCGYNGIYVVGQAAISGNVVYQNTQNGIRALNGATIMDNSVSYNGNYGIFTNGASVISGNTVDHNSMYGIFAGSTGSTVTANSVTGNQWTGIYLADFCLADRNTAYSNKLAGGSYVNMTPAATCATCVYGTNLAP